MDFLAWFAAALSVEVIRHHWRLKCRAFAVGVLVLAGLALAAFTSIWYPASTATASDQRRRVAARASLSKLHNSPPTTLPRRRPALSASPIILMWDTPGLDTAVTNAR